MNKTIGEIAAEKLNKAFGFPLLNDEQFDAAAKIIDSCLPAPDPDLIKAREMATEYARLYECAEAAVAENCRTIARLEAELKQGLAPASDEDEWGIVYSDPKGVWQIIAKNGQIIIDNIGEFRFRDNKSREKADKFLAEQIRDNHNADLRRKSAPSPLPESVEEVVQKAVKALRPAGDGERVTLYNVILGACQAAIAAPNNL